MCNLRPCQSLIPNESHVAQALCINEYEGLVFNCDKAGGSACLKTGAEVIASLSFESHTVSYPVFGLGMLLIGFLLVAFNILDKSKLTFLPLGHVGEGYVRALGLPEYVANESVKVEKEMLESNLAAENWDVENNLDEKAVVVVEMPMLNNEIFRGESKNAVI
jgi:hypothetical protein